MMAPSIARVLAVGALFLGATLSCVGPGIYAQLEVVRADIEKAEKSGAMQCAPKELALAKTHAEFTDTELGEGDFRRANEHIDIAVENVQAAIVNSEVTTLAAHRPGVSRHDDCLEQQFRHPDQRRRSVVEYGQEERTSLPVLRIKLTVF